MNKTTAIRVSVQRELEDSEKEWIGGIIKLSGESLVFAPFEPDRNDYYLYPFHIRLSERGKFWVHSNNVESRRLFDMVRLFLTNHFVNVHPVAVKTLSSVPAKKDTGDIKFRSFTPVEEVVGLVDV